MAVNTPKTVVNEIGDIVRGMDPDEALQQVKDYIERTEKVQGDKEVFHYWRRLTENAKVNLVVRALSN